jgi:hypothetical protein
VTLQHSHRLIGIVSLKGKLQMRFGRCLLPLLLMLTVCRGLLAQDSKPLSPIPPGGFQFTGTWNCEGAFGSGAAHKSIYTGATILDGKWLELTERDVQPATGYLAKYLIGFDPDQKHLVEFDANNFGAAVYTSEQGWQANVLTMTSSISQDEKAPYAANRFLYTVAGPDTLTVDWQISKTANLKWQTSDHLVCKRSS